MVRSLSGPLALAGALDVIHTLLPNPLQNASRPLPGLTRTSIQLVNLDFNYYSLLPPSRSSLEKQLQHSRGRGVYETLLSKDTLIKYPSYHHQSV